MSKKGRLFCVLLCLFLFFPLVALGSTVYENDFEDGSLGDWDKWNFACSYSGSFSIVSQEGQNVLRYTGGTVAGGGDEAFVTGDTAIEDYAVEADVMLYDYVHQYMIAGIVARATDKDNMYIYTISASDQQNHSRAWIGKRVDGNPNLPLSCYTDVIQWMDIPINQEEWYRLKMEVVGNSIKCYIDGQLIFDITDNDLTAGKFGVFSAATDARFDNIQVASLDEPMTSECSTPSEDPLFSEDFSDGLAEWQVGSLYAIERQNHTPVVVDGVYEAGVGTANNGGHHIELPTPISGNELTVTVDTRNYGVRPGAGVNHLMLCEDNNTYLSPNGSSYCNGYSISYAAWRTASYTDLIFIRKWTNGTYTEIAEIQAPDIDDETWKAVQVKRDADGNWTACMDGVPLEATFADADLAYTNFTYLSTNLDGPDPINAMDNIKLYGSSSCPVAGELVFSEDFNDNDFSDWTETDGYNLYKSENHVTGAQSIDGVYIGGPGGVNRTGHYRSLPTTVNGEAITVEFEGRSRNVFGRTANYVSLHVDDTLHPDRNGYGTANGYSFGYNSYNGEAKINKLHNGEFTQVALANFPQDEEFHHLKFNRLADGSWQICVDGIPQMLDQNDADIEFTAFDFISFSMDPNDATNLNALDNIKLYGSQSCPVSGELVFSDDFDDNDISDWDEGSLWYATDYPNTPYVDGGIYIAGDGTQSGGHHKQIPEIGPEFTIKIDVRSRTDHGGAHFGIYADNQLQPVYDGLEVANGYEITASASSGYVAIRRLQDGNFTLIALTTAFPLDQDFHTVQVSRISDGTWQICVDGIPAEMDQNDADTTYQHFRYISIGHDANNNDTINALDNLEVYGTEIPTENTPPVLDSIGNKVVNEGELLEFVVSASDPNAGDTLIFSVSNLPSGAAFDEETQTFSWTPAFDQAGDYPDIVFTVNDGLTEDSETIAITVANVNLPPTVSATGSGVYEIFTPIPLGGEVSDYDGDTLNYQWQNQGQALFSGTVVTNAGGQEVQLPVYTIDNLSLGNHILVLEVTDGVNAPVSAEITAEIIDETPPTLAPVADPSVLWPPNHKMVDVVIDTHAIDNSGGAILLNAVVSSNEPQGGNGHGKGKKHSKGDKSPDWTEPEIDQANGIIYLQLRAERLGNGDGRVYTILIDATDQSGNTSQASVDVVVPHSLGKKRMHHNKHKKHSHKGSGHVGNHHDPGPGKGKPSKRK